MTKTTIFFYYYKFYKMLNSDFHNCVFKNQFSKSLFFKNVHFQTTKSNMPYILYQLVANLYDAQENY